MAIRCDIEIPEKVIQSLGISRDSISEVFKKELAAYFFEKRLLSFGQARQFSGLSVWEFIDFLRERKIPIQYSLTEYEEDSLVVEELSRCQS
ncbi:MAG: UPF0175 family protein [Thermodesulfovibrionales bacterium]|nr:UPF0175 family protein [Thermodesulfovibrionales bacterium]